MRRLASVGLICGLLSTGYAQETHVAKHPYDTIGPVSAYRYDYTPLVCPPCNDDSPIPVAETRRLLCELTESPYMSRQLEEVVSYALSITKGINREDVSVTLVEIVREDNGVPRFGHFQGNEPRVAGTVSNLFYATALYYSLQQNRIKVDSGMKRDLQLMLGEADADATNRIVDMVTGTSSGDALGGGAFRDFQKKRSYANWYFAKLGYEQFNVNQKIWTTSPSARDLQLLGRKLPLNYENSNRVTTNHVGGLLYLIDREVIVSACASYAIKSYMKRSVPQKKIAPLAGVSAGLPVGAHMWSVQSFSAGNHNEAAIVCLPNQKLYAMVIMTKYEGRLQPVITYISEIIINRLMTATGDDEKDKGLYVPKLVGR